MGQIIDNINNKINMDAKVMSDTGGGRQNLGILSCDEEKNFPDEVKYEKNDMSSRQVNVDNFKEYIKDKNARAKEEGQNIEDKEREEKEAEKEIMRNLSHEEINQLRMMGIDIEGANLKDLMGRINTMRGNAHRDEMALLMAEISFDSEDVEDLVIGNGGVVVAGSNVKIDNKDILQLIKSNLPISKEGIYKAHYNGGIVETTDAGKDIYDKISDQVNGIIKQAGYEINEKSISMTKDFIANDIPVTTENIDKYMRLSLFVDKGIDEIDESKLNEITDIELKAQKLYQDVKKINPDIVADMAGSKENISIASIKQYSIAYNKEVHGTTGKSDIAAKRQLEEIRLSMTYQAAVKLVKKDLYIETRELANVVNNLRSIKNEQIKASLEAAGLEVTNDNVDAYKNVSVEIEKLAFSHARVLAAPIMGEDFTVSSLNSFSAKFSVAERSYEAVGTAPRYDMGDSITKAFSNIENMLNEMNLEVNEENVRAARILGYNSLEISIKNITQVVSYDRQVKDLINNFYPEAVLGLIKDGVNPLDMEISELNAYINDKNYNKGVTEAKNFAAYLRSMEKKDNITAEERESYIGIYRMMDKLAKSGDREAGWLFANERRLTVRNLLGAMRSRKAAGMDISVDDDFGFVSELFKNKASIDEQIESAFAKSDGKTDTLEGDFNEVDLEHIVDKMNSENINRMMEENEIEQSVINYNTVDMMLGSSNKVQSILTRLFQDMHFDKLTKENEIDEETEKITESLNGEEVEIQAEDLLDYEGMAKIFTEIAEDKISDEKTDSLFDKLSEAITKGMYDLAANNETAGTLNLNEIKMACAGINILKQMAKHQNYQIPVKTNDGVKVMNIKLQKGEETGHIQINMKDVFGNISADISVNDGKLFGHIVSETSEGNTELSNLLNYSDSIIEGFDFSGVSFGKIHNGNKVADAGEGVKVSNEKLYKAAAAIVRFLGNKVSS